MLVRPVAIDVESYMTRQGDGRLPVGCWRLARQSRSFRCADA
jgi:hypothetical protein